MRILFALIAVTLTLPAQAVTPDELASVLARIEPMRADRTGYKPVVITPEEQRKAATAIQSGSRDGASWGVGVLQVPIAKLWSALNDEIGQAQGQYTAVVHSEILIGESCKPGRHVLQMIDIPVPFISGKWWIGKPSANGRLIRNSGGAVRELNFDSTVDIKLIKNPASLKLANARSPIVFTNGSWLLVAVDARHTYVEYYSRSDPGGGIPKSVARGLAANAIKSNFEAMRKFATQGSPRCPIK